MTRCGRNATGPRHPKTPEERASETAHLRRQLEEHLVPMQHPKLSDLLAKMLEFDQTGQSYSGIIHLPEHGAALHVTLSNQRHVTSSITIKASRGLT